MEQTLHIQNRNGSEINKNIQKNYTLKEIENILRAKQNVLRMRQNDHRKKLFCNKYFSTNIIDI